jgi:acyl dehydratase
MVSETDNVWFSHKTTNLKPMHFNAIYAAEAEFGELPVNGTFGVKYDVSAIERRTTHRRLA